MIATPNVTSVGCIFAHLYTLVNDSEHPYELFYSLMTDFFLDTKYDYSEEWF